MLLRNVDISLQHHTVSNSRTFARRGKVQNHINFVFPAASRTQNLNLSCSFSPLEYTRAVWAVAAVFCGEIDKKSSHKHLAGSELIFSWIVHAINFIRLESIYEAT
jgi:hypothetical protein